MTRGTRPPILDPVPRVGRRTGLATELFRKEALSAQLDPLHRGALVQTTRVPVLLVFLVLFGLFLLIVGLLITQRTDVTATGRGVVGTAAPDFVVRAPVSGYVGEVRTAVGRRIARGEALVAFQRAEVDARLLRRRANLEEQVRVLRRLGAGDRPGSVSMAESDPVASTTRLLQRAEQAERVERARDEVALLESERSRAEVQAPIQGVVGALFVEAGAYIREGEPLLRILRSGDPLVGMMRVAPGLRARVRVGQTVLLKLDAFPYHEHGFGKGRVRAVVGAAVRDHAQPLTAPPGDVRVEVELLRMPRGSQGTFQRDMAFTGELVIQTRRVISLVFPALAKILGE